MNVCREANNRGHANSVHMLQRLQDACPRARVSLYHTPQLRGWLKRVVPARYDESVGVTHLKALIFDEDLLVSGFVRVSVRVVHD